MAKQMTQLAVCGLHLRGQPLNSQLTDLGANFVKACKSSSNYRMFVLPAKGGKPAKPGMIKVTDKSGSSVDLEIWELEVDKLGHFLMKVPPPLALGTVELEGDATCLGFVAEGWIAGDQANEDITHLGSWLKYVESLKA